MTTFVKPRVPGTYITFVGEQTIRPAVAVSSTVAIPIVHDWGPLGSEDGAVLVRSFGEFESIFGNGDSRGRDAVLGAFVGPGIPGEPGAGGVLVYRMATGSAAPATITINNTAGSPAAALKLDAKYPGTRGNRISVVVEDDPSVSGNDRLRVLFDDLTVEKFSYTQTDITSLADAINARSQYITADDAPRVTGTALDQTDDGDLASGNDGSSITSTQWLDALAALEYESFSILAPYDLSDAAIQATLVAWLQGQADEMRPSVAVIGGGSGEDTLDEAITRTDDLRDPHVISLGAGTFHDDFTDKDCTTAQLAARVAGALAGRGETSSLTFCKFAGLSLVGAPAVETDQLAAASDAGVTVFRRTSNEEAELMIGKAVTTFVDDTDVARPVDIFGDPRQVRVMDLFIRRIKQWGDDEIVGQTTVRQETRTAVADRGKKELADLLTRGLILPGTDETDRPFFRVVETGDPELDDAIPFEFGWKPARTTHYLVGIGKVR